MVNEAMEWIKMVSDASRGRLRMLPFSIILLDAGLHAESLGTAAGRECTIL